MSNCRNRDNVITKLYVYLVIYCEYQTITEVKLKEHTQYNQNDARYSCDQCANYENTITCLKSILKFNLLVINVNRRQDKTKESHVLNPC